MQEAAKKAEADKKQREQTFDEKMQDARLASIQAVLQHCQGIVKVCIVFEMDFLYSIFFLGLFF